MCSMPDDVADEDSLAASFLDYIVKQDELLVLRTLGIGKCCTVVPIGPRNTP